MVARPSRGQACRDRLIQGWKRRDSGGGRRKASVPAVEPAEAAIEVDGLAAVIDLRPRVVMWLVAEDDARAAGDLQPAVEALRLSREDVGAAEHFPELGFLAVREQLADAGVDRVDGVGLVFLEQCRVRIAAAVLRECAVCEPDHRGPVAQPFLQWSIFRELVEILPLASYAHPEYESRRIPLIPSHCVLEYSHHHDYLYSHPTFHPIA